MPEKYRNRLKTGIILNNYIIKYYKELKSAHEDGKLVASVSLGFPSEILYAMDIIPMYSQEHSAMYSVSGKAQAVLEKVEGKGYLTDICSEVKISLGAILFDMQLNFTLPKPDIVLAASNVCRSMPKFSQQISESLDVPCYIVDFPYMTDFHVPPHHKEYVTLQLKDMIRFLEKVTGKSFDYERLVEVMKLTRKTLELWQEIINFGSLVPSPLDAMDLYLHMFPLSVFRGTQDAVDYYKILRHEVYDRVEKGISAVSDEKYRLLWEFMPIFQKTNFLSRTLSKRKAAFVTSTYLFTAFDDICDAEVCNPDGFCIENSDELLNAAVESYMRLYVNLDINQRVRIIRRLVQRYSIDGVVIHYNHSCKPQSLIQPQLKNSIEKELGIPCLAIDADSSDPRFFSDAPLITRIEAFIESLA